MFLAIVYVVLGALIAGIVIWVLVAGGSPLHDYLGEQHEQRNHPWKVVIILVGVGVAMIFMGLRTLFGQEDKMSRLAALRREWHGDTKATQLARSASDAEPSSERTREGNVDRGPRPTG